MNLKQRLVAIAQIGVFAASFFCSSGVFASSKAPVLSVGLAKSLNNALAKAVANANKTLAADLLAQIAAMGVDTDSRLTNMVAAQLVAGGSTPPTQFDATTEIAAFKITIDTLTASFKGLDAGGIGKQALAITTAVNTAKLLPNFGAPATGGKKLAGEINKALGDGKAPGIIKDLNTYNQAVADAKAQLVKLEKEIKKLQDENKTNGFQGTQANELAAQLIEANKKLPALVQVAEDVVTDTISGFDAEVKLLQDAAATADIATAKAAQLVLANTRIANLGIVLYGPLASDNTKPALPGAPTAGIQALNTATLVGKAVAIPITIDDTAIKVITAVAANIDKSTVKTKADLNTAVATFDTAANLVFDSVRDFAKSVAAARVAKIMTDLGKEGDAAGASLWGQFQKALDDGKTNAAERDAAENALKTASIRYDALKANTSISTSDEAGLLAAVNAFAVTAAAVIAATEAGLIGKMKNKVGGGGAFDIAKFDGVVALIEAEAAGFGLNNLADIDATEANVFKTSTSIAQAKTALSKIITALEDTGGDVTAINLALGKIV